MTYRVRSLDHCLAVFEGGGVRVSAYAGAYAACCELGVGFAELAGSSGGAIAAALVATRASAEDIKTELLNLSFKDLLAPPRDLDRFRPYRLAKLLSWLPSRRIRQACRVGMFGGLYSPSGIQDWLERSLCRLLGGLKPQVRFKDLPLPLHVVAADIMSGRPKVWSTYRTPDSSVAFAVMCSCAIPFFFQPVHFEGTVLADGGLIANLPTFVYSDSTSAHYRPHASEILAFRLAPERGEWVSPHVTPAAIVLGLIDAVVDGGTAAQLALDSGKVMEITIPSGRIRATDFDLMDDAAKKALYQGGAASTLRALQSWRDRTDIKATRVSLDEEQTYLSIVGAFAKASSSIAVATRDTEWVYGLYPSIVAAIRRNLTVRVVAPRPLTDKERHRLLLLAGSGCNVHVCEWEDVAAHGFGFDLGTLGNTRAILFPFAERGRLVHSVEYCDKSDGQVIRLFRDAFDRSFDQSDALVSLPPRVVTIASIDGNILAKRLVSGVDMYRGRGVTITAERVATSRLRFLARYIREFKYRQLPCVLEWYEQLGRELFEPLTICLSGGKQSIVTPPVVEEHGDDLVLIGGTTRSYWAVRSGIGEVVAMVVRGVTTKLPGTPVAHAMTRLCAKQLPPGERTADFDYALFRSIERSIHPAGELEDYFSATPQ